MFLDFCTKASATNAPPHLQQLKCSKSSSPGAADTKRSSEEAGANSAMLLAGTDAGLRRATAAETAAAARHRFGVGEV